MEVTAAPAERWPRTSSISGIPKLNVPSSITGLTDMENALLAELGDVWIRHAERNHRLSAYYEAKEPLNDFGLAVPDKIKENYTPLGWARKAVDMLAELCVLEGFVAPGMEDPFGLQETIARLGFTSVLQQSITSALVHGCSFLTVGRGADGMTPTIRTNTAESSAAVWDYQNRRVKACMTVSDVDSDDNATAITLYMPDRTILVERDDSSWDVTADEDSVDGRCMAFRIAYKPTQTKPFGRSRISRDAMRLIDGANRIMVRAEANAEYYAFPKILLLGTSDDLANVSGEQALRMYMGRYNVISKDEDGQTPSVVQLAASSMDPHLTMLKSWASAFASAMNIPASSLGVVSDSNPTSAEATEAQREDLIIEARHADRDFGEGVLEAVRMAVRLTDPSVSESDLLKLQCDWINPSMPATSMSADAFSKLAGSITGFGDSEVGLSRAGMSRSEIIRLKADQRKANASKILDQVRANRTTAAGGADVLRQSEPDAGAAPTAGAGSQRPV